MSEFNEVILKNLPYALWAVPLALLIRLAAYAALRFAEEFLQRTGEVDLGRLPGSTALVLSDIRASEDAENLKTKVGGGKIEYYENEAKIRFKAVSDQNIKKGETVVILAAKPRLCYVRALNRHGKKQ